MTTAVPVAPALVPVPAEPSPAAPVPPANADRAPAPLAVSAALAAAAPGHAWLPVSTCDARCVEGASLAPRWIALTRWMRLVIYAVLLPFVVAACGAAPRASARLRRGYASCALASVGIRLHVEDRRGREGRAPATLVVAPHVSWADILVVAAVCPGAFVARADLLGWGLLGRIARASGVIGIERDRLSLLPGVVDLVSTRLRSGRPVIAFPEGTTWCGRVRGRLHPALFQAAVDAAVPVTPVAVRYEDAHHACSTSPAFVGTEGFVDAVRRLVAQSRVEARVVVLPAEEPGDDRRELAERCRRALDPWWEAPLADHGDRAARGNTGDDGHTAGPARYPAPVVATVPTHGPTGRPAAA